MRRFSIAGLMGFVLIAGVGFAALQNPTNYCTGMIMLLTGGMLCASLLGVVYRRGEKRAWWLGFMIFEFAYLITTWTNWGKEFFYPNLPTTYILKDLDQYFKQPGTDELSRVSAELEIHGRKHAELLQRKFPGGTPSPSEAMKDAEVLASANVSSSLVARFNQAQGRINEARSMARYNRPRVGHDLFALLAGAIGSMIAWVFYRTRGVETQTP